MAYYIASVLLLFVYAYSGQPEPHLLLASGLFAIAGAIQSKK